ncbi:hypothetical protein AB6C88_17240 [Vibrio splendidus]
MSFYEQAQSRAVVIKLGDRFFSGFGKQQRVLTAWSLAGARLFLSVHDDRVKDTLEKLDEKKKKYEVIFVEVSHESET